MKDLEKVIVAGLLSIFSVATFSKEVEESKTDGDSCYSIADVQDYSYWGNVELIATCVLGQEAPALGAADSVSQAASTAGVAGENIEVGRGETSSFEPQAVASNNAVAVGSILPAGDSDDGLTSNDQSDVTDSEDGLISIELPEIGDGEEVALPESGDGGNVAQPEIVEEDIELHILIPEREDDNQYVGYYSEQYFESDGTFDRNPSKNCSHYGTCLEGQEVGALLLNAEDNSEDDAVVNDRIALKAYSATGEERFSHTFDENYDNTPTAHFSRSQDRESVSVTFDEAEGIVAAKELTDVEGTSNQPGYFYDSKYEELSGEGGSYNYTSSADESEEPELVNIRLLYVNVAERIGLHSDGVASPAQVSNREIVVSGALTHLSDIQDLINSNAIGVYHGESNRWEQKVDIEVDFGAETFVANVGESSIAEDLTNQYYFDNVSFTATGDIRGAHLVSTSVSAADSNDVSGILQGSFVSEKAAGIIGAYDVSKGEDRIVDTFSTVREDLVEVNQ